MRRTTWPAASFTVSTTTGFSLAPLRLDLRPARERRVLPGLDERLLLLLPRLLAAPDVVGQVVGEDGAERRVRRREVGGALRGLAALPERLALDVPPGLADREEGGLLRERLLRRPRAAPSSRRGRRSRGRTRRPRGRSRAAGWRGRGRRWSARRRRASPSGAPPSVVKKRPNSVPAKSRSGFTWSWTTRQTRCRAGRSPAIERQVRPRSVLFRRYGRKSPDLWSSSAT